MSPLTLLVGLTYFVYKRVGSAPFVVTLSLLVTVAIFGACSEPAGESHQMRFALACAKGDINSVKNLLLSNEPIDVNAVNGRVGPCLVGAAYGGHDELVALVPREWRRH